MLPAGVPTCDLQHCGFGNASRMPAMPDFSSLELSTARLRLRALRAEDAGALFAIFSDPVVCRYLSWGTWASIDVARERAERYVREMAAGESVTLLIVRKEDDAVLGDCTLFSFDAQCRRAEVGYSLATAAWGRGYVQEAVGALLQFGFDAMDLHRVEADIDPLNAASARSLERLGFVREGLLRERWIVEGQVSDSAIYGLLRRDWEAARAGTPDAPARGDGHPNAGR
jgi:RimJ/RimL family protein N-acetyltransferase